MKILSSLTVVVEYDSATSTGRAFMVSALETGGSRARRLSQEQLDTLAEWIEDVTGDEPMLA